MEKNNFKNMGNSTVNVEAKQDPMQLLAFDTHKKMNIIIILMILLLILNGIALFFIAQDKLSHRSQYDQLRYIASEMKENLEKLDSVGIR